MQRLGKAWSLVLDQSGNEITPLVHGGILFVHSGASLTAVDAASGTPLWKYQRKSRALPARHGSSTQAGGRA
ncbi:MAG: hypothetical protein IPM70_12950 [Proteobacteria bacterium]|nr:hypothetical protein [Pseudomonadota bacterium]